MEPTQVHPRSTHSPPHRTARTEPIQTVWARKKSSAPQVGPRCGASAARRDFGVVVVSYPFLSNIDAIYAYAGRRIYVHPLNLVRSPSLRRRFSARLTMGRLDAVAAHGQGRCRIQSHHHLRCQARVRFHGETVNGHQMIRNCWVAKVRKHTVQFQSYLSEC